MTTIACDGKTIAGDGLVTGNDMIHDLHCVKVHRLQNGSVAGFAGSAFDVEQAVKFLNDEVKEIDLDESFEAIILHHGGDVECMNNKGRKYRQSTPCASGSGSPFALAAMDLGFSSEEAVKVAIERDIYSGGTIFVKTPSKASA